MLHVLGLRWRMGEAGHARRAEAIAASLGSPWRKVLGHRGVLAFVRDDPTDTPLLELPDQSGFIIGQAFERANGVSRPLVAESVDSARAKAWVETRGDQFIQQCWGPTIVFLHDRWGDDLSIFRDAGGARPFFVDLGAAPAIFFTHVEDWLERAPDREIDRDYLAAFVAHSRIVSTQTGFKDVEELIAGERVTFTRDGDHWDMAWRPPAPSAVRSVEACAAMLRGAVFDCGQAWRRASGKITHRLSGGLDSSIVLAALHQIDGGEIVCVNERADNMPEADEFAFACLTAARWGDRVEAWTTDPTHIDYERLLGMELHAKPSLSDFGHADPAALLFAAECADKTLTSGQGGDQIFQRGRAPLLVADAIQDGLPVKEVLSVARHAAYLSRTHIWEVLGDGLRYAPRWARFDPIAKEVMPSSIATQTGVARAGEIRRAHNWLKSCGQLSPVRRTRILRIIDLAFYALPSVLSPRSIQAPVLASRPIIECAHAIAPYLMIDGGVDRGLARRAFADWVAPEVMARTLKGNTTRFHTIVLERNRAFMREILLGGRLVEEGLVNASVLQEALSRQWAADGALNSSLINCVAAETWLRRLDRARARIPSEYHLTAS